MANIDKTNLILSRVTKSPTDIYGLKYHPSVEPHISNDTDWFEFTDGIDERRDLLTFCCSTIKLDMPLLKFAIGALRSGILNPANCNFYLCALTPH